MAYNHTTPILLFHEGTIVREYSQGLHKQCCTIPGVGGMYVLKSRVKLKCLPREKAYEWLEFKALSLFMCYWSQSNAVKCIYVECDLEDAGPTTIARNLEQERNGVGSGPKAPLAWDWQRRQKSRYHTRSIRKGSFEWEVHMQIKLWRMLFQQFDDEPPQGGDDKQSTPNIRGGWRTGGPMRTRTHTQGSLFRVT